MELTGKAKAARVPLGYFFKVGSIRRLIAWVVFLAVLAVVLSSVVGFSAQATADSGWAPAPPPTWDEYLYALGSRAGGE